MDPLVLPIVVIVIVVVALALRHSGQTSSQARVAWQPPPLPAYPKRQRPPVAERTYATTTCPHCGVALNPLPRAKKMCPSCRQPILVRTGDDDRVYLLAERQLDDWFRQMEPFREKRLRQDDKAYDLALTEAGYLAGPRQLSVVGESHYQGALERSAGGRQTYSAHEDCIAMLVREPRNSKDRNAVALLVDGRRVGYLSRAGGAAVQPLMLRLEREGKPAWVRATIVGGWDRGGGDRGFFGLEIDGLPRE